MQEATDIMRKIFDQGLRQANILWKETMYLLEPN